MILVFGAICLLMNGSVKHVAGIQSFPPTDKGEFLHIELHPEDSGAHELQRVYFRCQGNDSSPRPTLLLDDGEGLANWLGMLDAAPRDRRVCAWDHLGFGHSDYAYLDQLRDSAPFYKLLLSSLRLA